MIFLHSSFRTSSTWFWSCFRRLDRVVAYNEIFNEQLASITRQQAVTRGPEGWHSKHPDGAAYFLEFLPFIRETGGAEGYDRSMALSRFVPRGGIAGDIAPEEQAYVAALIAGAERLQKIPVLSCTRTLGRLRGLQRAFPGLHILLHRNIFHHWCSYCEQLDGGNSYFLDALRETIAGGQHDPILRLLHELLPLGAPAADGLGDLYAFVLLHLYLYAHGAEAADLLVDATRLSAEPAYARGIEAAIADRTGLAVDLSNARASLGYSLVDIGARPGLMETLRGLAAPILLSAPPGKGRIFAEQALAAFAEEAERYAFYAGTLAKRLKADRAALAAKSKAPGPVASPAPAPPKKEAQAAAPAPAPPAPKEEKRAGPEKPAAAEAPGASAPAEPRREEAAPVAPA